MSDEKPEIQLFIKSSTIDREQKGSCPLCQQWFMAACILTEQGVLSFHVTIVDAESPPKEFKDLSQSKIFPVVKGIRGLNKRGQDIGDKLADDHEGLEEFFESFGCPDLKRDGAVQKHFDDLYKFFNLFLQNPNEKGEKLTQKLEKLNAFLESEDERYVIKDYLTYGDCYLMPRLQHIKVGARHFNAFLQNGTDQARNRLRANLEKLNGFLEGEDQIYVTKDLVTYGDCYLMPRLHHIKVACREFADFEIPEEYFYVWRYLYETYKTDAFQKTCPTDQDIIKHYEKKAKVFKPKKGVPSLQKSTYSFDIAESVLNTLENEPQRQDVNADNSQPYESANNGQEEENIYEAPDNDHEQESSNDVYDDGAPDNGYDQETRTEVDHEPEQATYEAPDEAEAVPYEAPDEGDAAIFEAPGEAEPAAYEAPDQPEPETYDAVDVADPAVYEAPAEENINTYETAQYDENIEGNTYDDAQNYPADDPPSASPDADRPASPTRSVSPAPDGGAEVDHLEQTYDDPTGYDASKLPPNNTFKSTAPSNDQHEPEDLTQAGQDESLYENVETRGVPEPSNKSVDFSLPHGNPGVEVNGTNGHD